MPLPIAAGWIGLALRSAFAWLIKKGAQWMPSIVGQVLVALGIHFAVNGGMEWVLSEVQSRFSLVEGASLETLYFLNVDDFVTLVLGALAARQAASVVVRKRAAVAP